MDREWTFDANTLAAVQGYSSLASTAFYDDIEHCEVLEFTSGHRIPLTHKDVTSAGNLFDMYDGLRVTMANPDPAEMIEWFEGGGQGQITWISPLGWWNQAKDTTVAYGNDVS